MPPLLAWAQELRRAGAGKRRSPKGPGTSAEVVFLIGAKNKEKVLGSGECRRWGIEAQVATEDGGLGTQGMATDLLEKELMTGRHSSTTIYACGPNPMLARVAQVADQFDLPCQVLLESRMACGVGACLGCTVKYREEPSEQEGRGRDSVSSSQESNSASEGQERATCEGAIPEISEVPPFRYARVCKEGPVFDARKIFWD